MRAEGAGETDRADRNLPLHAPQQDTDLRDHAGPFNLMGLDQWVGALEFVNYFDVNGDEHLRVFKSTQRGTATFQSLEGFGPPTNLITSIYGGYSIP
ncbi:MAG: hypothetical protein Q4P24_14110 [Rhodobacterales bacterium]|nr:hypothetical protein [Rhodobacterales bacterium]